ncbi:MAG: hypothetical protein KDC92_16565 [Bacteroidetes bacterium]|nr:hypothetical protein [Bacteroidota bacterium]
MFRERKFTLLAFAVMALTACRNNAKTGANKSEYAGQSAPKSFSYINNVFKSKVLGWSINVPQGWLVTTPNELDSTNEMVQNDAFSIEQHLIMFQNGDMNVFQSSYEPVTIKSPEQWKEHCKGSDAILHSTYTNQGIKLDTASKEITVAGKPFHALEIQVYDPDGNPLLKQYMYNTLIDSFDFGVNISAENDAMKNIMMQAFEGSRFEK